MHDHFVKGERWEALLSEVTGVEPHGPWLSPLFMATYTKETSTYQRNLRRGGNQRLSSGDTQCGRVATKSRRFRHIMLVIALHSLDGVGETGLRVCPAEKNTAKLGCGVKQDTFSGPVSGRQSQNCADFQRFLGEGSRVSLQLRLLGGAR